MHGIDRSFSVECDFLTEFEPCLSLYADFDAVVERGVSVEYNCAEVAEDGACIACELSGIGDSEFDHTCFDGCVNDDAPHEGDDLEPSPDNDGETDGLSGGEGAKVDIDCFPDIQVSVATDLFEDTEEEIDGVLCF